MQVVKGIQTHSEHLFDAEQMMKIGTRITEADRTAARRINRPLVASVLCVLDEQPPEGGEEPAGPSVPGGNHTIKEIHASRHSLDEVLRHSDAHQVPGPFGGKRRYDGVEHAVHDGLAAPTGR